MNRSIFCRAAVALTAGLLGASGPLVGQAPPELDSGGIQLSRQQLEERLQAYEESAESSAYSAQLRSTARQEAELVRARLSNGDFRVGDQIELWVEREDPLTGTFVVSPGGTLELPVVGAIPLAGVLRSELEGYLTKQLAQFIREPRVRARALFRVTVTGAVAKPGFYVVPADVLLTDALMAAGGPGGRAKLTAIRVERDGRSIWEGRALQQAITEGRTLDQLSIEAGDQIVIPEDRGGIGRSILYGLSAASSVVLLLTRIF